MATASASLSDLATRGLKRVCAHCGTRFYDMNKRPIACPSCKTEFSSDLKTRVRRSRPAPDAAETSKPLPEEEDVEIITREDDLVSLEDVEESTDDDDLDDAEGDLELDDGEDIEDDLDKEIDVELDEEK